MPKEPKYIIIAGASAVGINALSELVAQLNVGMDAAVFIVLHLSKTGIGATLPRRFQQFTPLTCLMAKDGDSIEKGKIYIAVPDYHLIIKKGIIKIVKGPVENRWRPSIDVLFRSAAVAYGSSVIGIILTGLLDDGTSGMLAIKKCGGITIVQDPDEAEFSDMPLSVLSNMEVNYCAPLAQMGFIIHDVIEHIVPQKMRIPPEIISEAEIAEKTITSLDAVSQLGSHSLYACPDCGGGLWEIEEQTGQVKYRCHVGHCYSEKDLLTKQGVKIESTLWVALRMMEERFNLLRRTGEEEKKKGHVILSKNHLERADEMKIHIRKLKELLFSGQKSNKQHAVKSEQ